MHAFDFKEALQNSLYTGMIDAEHISLEPYQPRLLVNQYWKSQHNAELDFLISQNGKVLPIEVKAANNTKSKSLKVYRETYAPSKAIKISANNFNESNGIQSIPLYAAYMIRE